MSQCTRDLQESGVAYPRTCAECGLGPCKRYPVMKPVRSDGWIDVKERLPEPMQIVIVSGGVAIIDNGVWKSLTACEWPGRPIQWTVTHWQPIPPL